MLTSLRYKLTRIWRKLETRICVCLCVCAYRDGEVAGEMAIGGIPAGNVGEEIGIGGGGIIEGGRIVGGGGGVCGGRVKGWVRNDGSVVVVGEVEEVLDDEVVGGGVDVGGGGGGCHVIRGGELWAEAGVEKLLCLH